MEKDFENFEKRCGKCKEIKPLVAFPNSVKRAKDKTYRYKSSWCRKCTNAKTRNRESWKIYKKIYDKKWIKTENGKLSRRKTHSEQKAKRKKYGYNMLNVYFPGSVGHHINDMDVVFIPENIHVSCYCGKNKELHRKKLLDLYGNIENMINNIPEKES